MRRFYLPLPEKSRLVFIMPVGISQVFNNTSYNLQYHNNESKHGFKVPPKTDRYEKEDCIPSSNYKDDTLPWYDYNDYDNNIIAIKFGYMSPINICENNAQFRVSYPTGHLGEYAEKHCGKLRNGRQYILRFDEITDNGCVKLSLMIYVYESKLQTRAGHVGTSLLLHATVAVRIVILGELKKGHRLLAVL